MNEPLRGNLLIACLSDDRQPMLLARARALAEAARLSVYVYRPVQDPGREIALSPSPERTIATKREEFQRSELQHQHMLEWLSGQGLSVEGRVEWQPAPVPAMLDVIDALEPRFVLLGPKDEYSRTARLLLSDQDFELIRRSSAPVWLARRYPEPHKTILAAVDPMPSHDRADSVDHSIVRTAASLAIEFGHQAHVIHTYTLPEGLVERLEGLFRRAANAKDAQRVEDEHVERVHALAHAHGIASSQVHIGNGDLIEIIETLIEPLNVDLVVLGATSRSRVERMLVGGTAEKLLRSVDVDLLVIKPPSENPTTGSTSSDV